MMHFNFNEFKTAVIPVLVENGILIDLNKSHKQFKDLITLLHQIKSHNCLLTIYSIKWQLSLSVVDSWHLITVIVRQRTCSVICWQLTFDYCRLLWPMGELPKLWRIFLWLVVRSLWIDEDSGNKVGEMSSIFNHTVCGWYINVMSWYKYILFMCAFVWKCNKTKKEIIYACEVNILVIYLSLWYIFKTIIRTIVL